MLNMLKFRVKALQRFPLSYRRKTKTSILLLLILSVSSLSLSSISIFPAYAAPEVYMVPSVNAFSTNTTSLGYKWNITFYVKDVADLFAYQVYLTVDDSMLNITRAWLPTWDPAWVFTGREMTVPALFFYDLNTNGYKEAVKIADTIVIGPTYPQPGDTVPGKLAIIELKIIAAPPKNGVLSSVLGINNTNTKLLDSTSPTPQVIPSTKTDGSFTYTWVAPKPNVAVRRTDELPWPLEFGSSPPPTGQAFNVNVMIENLDSKWGLIEANMTIAYNASVIDIIGGAANVTIDPTKWTDARLAINNNLDPTLDNITIHVKPISPWVPSGNVTVATIQFTVAYPGPFGIDIISPLDFIENILVDDPGPALIPQNPPVNGTIVIRGMTIEARLPVRLPPYTPDANQYITNKLETFNVTVRLNDLAAEKRLISLQFRLKYNATLLKVLNVAEGPFMSSFPNRATPPYTFFTWFSESDDLYGPHVVIGIVLLGNETGQYYNFPYGSGALATVTFQGIYRGFYPEKNNSTLELVDVLLLDDKLNSIITTPKNGYYEILSYRSPEAAFTYAPSVLNATVPVVFNASNSRDFDLGYIANYTWNFGDGNAKNTTQSVIEHVYMAPGVYNVNLTVTDDDGQTNSTAKSITVAKLTSTISIRVAPLTITFSQSATINGTISPVRQAVNVAIAYRLQGETNWQTLITVKTDTEGKYSYNWAATKKTLNASDNYELKASWPGDEITDPAQGITAEKLIVNRAKGTIPPINLNPSTLTVGSKVTINGTVSPRRGTSVNVTISYRLRGGLWLPLATVGTDSDGNYKYIWTTIEAGIFEIRTNNAGDENAGPAQSTIATLTVNKAASTITINVNLATVTVGSDVTISGTIMPAKREVNITIYHKRLDGTWITLGIAKTDLNGSYTFTWKTSQAGTYEIKASWLGDENTLSAESDPKSVNVEAPTNLFLYILIAAIALIAVALTLIYKKTRKSKQTLK